jgi:hypothetical protein
MSELKLTTGQYARCYAKGLSPDAGNPGGSLRKADCPCGGIL